MVKKAVSEQQGSRQTRSSGRAAVYGISELHRRISTQSIRKMFETSTLPTHDIHRQISASNSKRSDPHQRRPEAFDRWRHYAAPRRANYFPPRSNILIGIEWNFTPLDVAREIEGFERSRDNVQSDQLRVLRCSEGRVSQVHHSRRNAGSVCYVYATASGPLRLDQRRGIFQ